MPGRSDVGVKLEGFDEIYAKLAGKPIYAEAWRNALTQATAIAHLATVARSPRMSGKLRGGLSMSIDTYRVVPLYGIAQFSGVERDGFRYGGALESSGRYHYRSGPNKGKPTLGWFSESIKAVRSQVGKLLSEAVQEIEAKWRA